MKIRYALLNVVIALCAIGCTNKSGGDHQTTPEPPLKASELEEFCRNVNYGDTAEMHDERSMERHIATIINIIRKSDNVAIKTGMTTFFNGLRHDETALNLATQALHKYLAGPSSPIRNEELYINILSILLENDSLPALERDVATRRMQIASLNRKGTTANDFSYEEPDGSRGSLYDTLSPAILVIFYNPECGPCSQILAGIAADPVINTAIDLRLLKVIAIYAEGDKKVWRSNIGELPDNWIIGIDTSGILDNETYDLPAMPTLYLLDANKRVILKDPSHPVVSRYLQRALKAGSRF